MLLILMFMYIFSFKIYLFFDSTIFVGIIMGYFYITKAEYRRRILNGIKNKYVININICLILLMVLSGVSLLINGSSDFTYLKTLIHLYLNLFIGYFVFCYYDFKGRKEDILNHILLAFFIQSCLQWFFFIFPSISKIFNIFRTESMILNNIKYSGYRGLALSSTGFFGLSSAYGVISILFFSKHNTLYEFGIKKYIFLLIMYSGTFFAGRTGFIALPFVLVLTIMDIKQNSGKYSNKSLYKNIMIAFCALVGIFIITYNIPKFKNMYNYAFELVQNVFDGKGFFTTSTDKMFKMYDVDISSKTLIYGDGKYTVSSAGGNHYYQNTDIGYLRKILFFGLPGLLLSIYFEFIIFGKNMKININKLVFLLLLIYELKGEVFGISILMNSILLLYSMDMLDFLHNDEFVIQSCNSSVNMAKVINYTFTKDNKDKITVIMSVYNESVDILKQAIESILNQTFQEYKVIIVMDSIDNEEAIKYLKKIEKNKKIKVLFNKKNMGLPLSLNKAIRHVNTKYIARMDADDIALLNRLEVQYNYMESNNDIDLISAGVIYMNYNGEVLYERENLPTGYRNVAKVLSYVNILHHPTFFGKTELFKKIMYSNLKYAQDYDFACRACENGYKVDLINEVLLKYRLPIVNQENKKIRQLITAYYIRKLYKRQELSQNNISEMIETEVSSVDNKKIILAIELYEKAFTLKRQKKYISCTYNIIKSMCLSKYHRRIVFDMIHYFYIKKFWRIVK